MTSPVNRASTGCLTLAFLTLLTKALAGYAVYALAREVHAAATVSEVTHRVGAIDPSMVEHLMTRWRGEAYMASAAHMQVLMVALATAAYAGAIAGGRWAAVLLAILVLAGIPVDLPLGVVEFIQRSAGTATDLPAALTWSWVPRNPLAIMRWCAGEPAGGWSAFEHLAMPAALLPGMLAATAVLSASLERRDPDGTPAPAIPRAA